MKGSDIAKKIGRIALKIFIAILIIIVFLFILFGIFGVVLINKFKNFVDKNKNKTSPQPPPTISRPPQTTIEKNAEQEQKALAEATGIPFIPPQEEQQISAPPQPQEEQQIFIPPQEKQQISTPPQPQEEQQIFIPPQEEQSVFIPPQEEQQISAPPQEPQPTFTDIISNVFKGEQDSLVEQEQENQRLLAEQQRREQELLIQASREAEERQRIEQELLIQASLDAEERQRREQELLRQASIEAEEKQKREQELLAQQEKERQELLAQQEQTRLRLLAEQQKLEQELLAEQRRREAEIVAEQERILADRIRQEEELLASIKAEAKEIASSQLSGINADNVLAPLIDDIIQKTADSSTGLNTIGRQEVLVSNTKSAVDNLNALINGAKIRLAELVASVVRQEDLQVVADVRRNELELLLAKPVLATNLNNAKSLLTELVANARDISDKITSLEGRVFGLDEQIAKYIADINYYTRIINNLKRIEFIKKKDNERAREIARQKLADARSTRTALLNEIGELQLQLDS